MNEVICCICNKSVSKRQTLSVGNNKRACRSHSETQEASKNAIDQQNQKNKEHEQKLNDQKKRWLPSRTPIELKPTCIICKVEGIKQEEYFEKVLVEQKKYEIIYGVPPNPFNADEMQKALSALKDVTCLFWVKWNEKNKKIKLPFRAYEFMQISEKMFGTGIGLFCNKCCQEYKIERLSEETERIIDIKTIHYLHDLVEPYLRRQAINELSESN